MAPRKSSAPSAKKASPTAKPAGVKKPTTKRTTKRTTTKSATPAKAKAAGKAAAKPAKPKRAATKKTAKAPAAAKQGSQKKVAKDTVRVEANTKRKRKAPADDVKDAAAPKAKRAKAAPKPKRVKAEPKPKAPPKKGKIINQAPSEVLEVYSFGQGDMGELGLGATETDQEVTRPRLVASLSPEKAGVVQVAVGGMHAAVLTRDNKILTWGVNDHGALGRETGDGEINDDTGLNVLEVTPTAIDMKHFPSDIVFTSVAAGDSCTFALTDDGHVWGWGTYRANEGLLGFTDKVESQMTPMLVKGVSKIKAIACGANHTLALDEAGAVYSWGGGQKGQLGRRILERSIKLGLQPARCLNRKNIEYISCGENHAFAIAKNGNVYAWGINNYGQCGIVEGAGGEDAVVHTATVSAQLTEHKMKSVQGGMHHSIGVSGKDEALVWGRCDNSQLGVDIASLDKDVILLDERDRPRIVTEPTAVANIVASSTAAGSDASFVVASDGKVWSWGFGASYRHGLGTEEDVEIAKQMKGKAIDDKKIAWAGAGGQFGMLASKA